MINIVNLTSVHNRYDIRIFQKMCKSLSKKYNVSLIVADGKDNEVKDSINIFDVGKPINRKDRLLNVRKKIFNKALELNADVYHFHDPELIPIGLKLRKLGKKVIYDVHEDVPRQILSKPYLNQFFKIILSKGFEKYENYAARKFNAIVTATPYIRDRFLKMNDFTVDVNNFPKLNELYEPINWDNKKNEICYIGGISRIRGIIELVKALEYTDTILHLAGNFESKKLEQEVKALKGWKKVKYYGFVDRKKIKEILNKVKVGIVTLHPVPNYINSYPIKLFEYMSSAIPVIASDFPLWKNIIETNKCGICVDPLNPKKIGEIINYILENDNLAKLMGKRGRKIIEEKYNWEIEEKKLLKLYKEVIK